MLKSLLNTLLFVSIYTVSFAQNIGLHTITPQAPVHLANSGQVQTPGGFVLLGHPDEGHLELDFNIIQSNYGASPLDLMLQPYGGQVGINTINPDAQLHVASSGSVNTPGGLVLLGSRDEGHLEMDFNIIQSMYGPSSTLDLLLQPNGGKLGVNTTLPVSLMHIAAPGITNTTNGLLKIGSHANGNLELDYDIIQARSGASNYNTLRLQPNGGNVNAGGSVLFVDATNDRVGINDLTPSHALDVNGSIDVLDFIFHKGETDTYLGFLTDRIRGVAGGTQFIDFANTTQDYITLGNGNDIDVTVNNGMFLHGLNKQMAIGTAFNTPTSRLHVKSTAGESAFQVTSGTTRMIEVNASKDIVLGSHIDPDEPFVRSYIPMEIYPLGNNYSAALVIDGIDIGGTPADITGGCINVGDFGDIIMMDGDEIQAYDTDANVYNPLRLNPRGGDIVFGTEGVPFAVGVGKNDPATDLHVRHYGPSDNYYNGIRLENSDGDSWRAAIKSNGDYEMYVNNGETPKAVLSYVTGDWSSPSDRRFKKDITSLSGVLNKIAQLRPVTYHMQEQAATDPLIHGFIAQEVQEVFPEMVTNIGDKLGLQYGQFSVIAIQAVKELKAENDQLRNTISAMEERLAKLESLSTSR
jgi:hypothetical protein